MNFNNALLYASIIFVSLLNAQNMEVNNITALLAQEKEIIQEIQRKGLESFFQSIAYRCGRSSFSELAYKGPYKEESDSQDNFNWFIDQFFLKDTTSPCHSALAVVKALLDAQEKRAAYYAASQSTSSASAAAYSAASYPKDANQSNANNSAADYSKASYPR